MGEDPRHGRRHPRLHRRQRRPAQRKGISTGPALERWADRLVPTLKAFLLEADAALAAHGRERSPGPWLKSGLRAALLWAPVCLLAMLAGALLVSPAQLLAGGLGLAETPKGQWLLRQSWPLLLAKVLALDLILQAACAGLFALLRLRLSAPRCGAAVTLLYLLYLRVGGHPWMEAAPVAAIQAALLYAFWRSGSLLVPAASSMLLGAASLYSARMIVLLKADLGSTAALPGIPHAGGVLTVLALSAGLHLAAGLRWSPLDQSEQERAPLVLGLYWGLALYLASYLAYHLVFLALPVGETVPGMLKQALLMPLDMLAYIFVIGAVLEEVIFRAGLFRALARRMGGFWPAALLSSAVFSGFHFLDLSLIIRGLGLNVSKLVQSLLMVYSFSWAGFTGRVAAGLLLAFLYHRSRTLLLPIAAHFTSNMLEAVGLRFGLAWLLAAASGILALQLAARRPRDAR